MARLEFAAPLQWPEWKPVTPLVYRKNDRNFAPPMKLEESIRFLEDEMDVIKAKGTLSIDIDQPLNERARRKVGSRIGAALHMEYMERQYVLACDGWQMMEHNIYALHLALRHWRNMERWGVAPLPVLLAGFAVQKESLDSSRLSSKKTASNSEMPDWMLQLGLGPTATEDDAQAVYHRRAKKLADDTDGLVKLNHIMEEARAYFAKKR